MGVIAWSGAMVLGLNVYAALLIWLRSRLYGTTFYRPMLLNIGLSLSPVLIALGGIVVALAASSIPVIGPVVALGGLGLVVLLWTLAFPNSSYLITELNFSHRKEGDPVPLWFDIIQTLTLTVSGIANAIVSLGIMQLFVLALTDPNYVEPYPSPLSSIVALVLIALSTFGIYLGRYLRVNSWDVKHPFGFMKKIVGYFREPGHAADGALFVATHTVFLTAIYAAVFVPFYAALFFMTR